MDKVELIEDISGEYNLPTVYLMNTGDDRFLDDILLFCELDNSYIAKDFDFLDKDADFNKILRGQDISGGFLLFINNGQDNNYILYRTLLSTGLEGYKTVSVLNSGRIYYIGNGIEMEEAIDEYYATSESATETVTEEAAD